MDAIVDIQGFLADTNRFIPKEIAILSNGQVTVVLIKPPFPFYELSTTDKEKVVWIEKTKRMFWREGFVPYRNFKNCIEFLKSRNVYVKGSDKVTWIKKMLAEEESAECKEKDAKANTFKIYDLEDFGCPSLESLRKKYKSSSKHIRCNYHPRTCAYTNVHYLLKWSADNNVFYEGCAGSKKLLP